MTVTNVPTTRYSATNTGINQKSIIPQIQEYSTRDSGINQFFIIPQIQDNSARDSGINLNSQIQDANPLANLES